VRARFCARVRAGDTTTGLASGVEVEVARLDSGAESDFAPGPLAASIGGRGSEPAAALASVALSSGRAAVDGIDDVSAPLPPALAPSTVRLAGSRGVRGMAMITACSASDASAASVHTRNPSGLMTERKRTCAVSTVESLERARVARPSPHHQLFRDPGSNKDWSALSLI